MQRYISQEDATMRLHRTVVRFKKDGSLIPVMVTAINRDLNAAVFNLLDDSREVFVVETSDPALDISSPPLGNTVMKDEVAYLSRSTARQQKQGVDPRFLIANLSDRESLGFEGEWTDLGKTISGIFPSFEEAQERVISWRRKVGGYPFGRYLSLLKTSDKDILCIRHLINDVGLYIPKERVAILLKTYDEPRLRDKLRPYMEIAP